jgi:glycosyltransferase involved in cell wall biosynthesis
MTARRRLHVSLSIYFGGIGFTSAAVALAQNMPPPFEPVVFIPQLHGPLPKGLAHVRPLPPLLPARVAFSSGMIAWARRRNERNLLKAVRRAGPGSLVWIWPGASTGLLRELKAAKAVLIREMINTHVGTARRILDAEYARLNLPPSHENTEAKQRLEEEQLGLMDLIVSPSECVDESLLEWGIPKEKIIKSTFGWSPEKFTGNSRAALPRGGITALFVGTVGIRKGIHLALAAWDRARIDGTFIVVGPVDKEAAALVAPYRDRPDIQFVPFTRELPELYRASDFMFFPSLEEGAPLVCYQAGGCGLPILTSPMGRGRLVEDGTTGFVADAHDEATLAARLRELAGDGTLRQRLGAEIRKRAVTMDFASAAAQRAHAFLDRGL